MSDLLLKDKLRELRTRMHLTQSKVGQYLNMTRQGYAHYEAGLRHPDYQTLLKLSKLYQVDIGELINNHTTPIIPLSPAIKNKLPCRRVLYSLPVMKRNYLICTVN